MIPSSWLIEASERISPHILRTPLTYDERNAIYFKWENRQHTGSFKLHGALNKVLSLGDWERQAGLVGASAGNHGQGLAVAGSLEGAPVTVFASEHAVPAKLDAMRYLGAQVNLVPGGYAEAESAGIAYAKSSSAVWVSPYNDGQVIAGQGTLALESLQQLNSAQPEVWLVPVGGGGLISGIAWLHYQEKIEGSGAVPLAAWLTGKIKANSALLVITGGNIQSQVHESILQNV